MSISIYDAAVPTLARGLASLSGILRKGEQFAQAKGIDPSELLQARLAPDMFDLTRQVQVVTDTAKGCAGRLAGAEIPSYPDVETSFAELQDRLARARQFVEAADRSAFEGAEERTVVLKFPNAEFSFSGRDYLFGFVLPNFYFHMTTAYGILRHKGVELGKRDYLGGT